jgi:hypothetical protein
MQTFSEMINKREPAVDDVIGFMDGVSLASECTSDCVTQNVFYSGYDCDTMVNNMFAYGMDGKVFFAAINFPTSWDDGSLPAQFLPSIHQRIGNYKICVDQGFQRSCDAFNILVGPMNERSARRLHPLMYDYLLCLSNVYTLLHQASEWGMRGIQGSFPCCKKQLLTQSNIRRLVLESIVLIHKFCTKLVGSKQIKTVSDPEYE